MDSAPAFDKITILRLAFKGLEEDELQEMAALTRLCNYPANHVLCQEDVAGDIFFVIADGHAMITKRISEQEGEHLLRIAGPGEWIGEMALIQDAPRAATVRTTTECTVLEMDKQDFETMLSRSPRMAIDIIRVTLDRMRENDQLAIEDLKKANQVLRLLDRNKLEFIQVAAHELRTPITVLAGYANLLRSFPDIKANSAVSEVLDGITKGTERMSEVVNLMLDVTRIDSDMKIASVPVPLTLVIDILVQNFSKAVSERRIALTVEHDPGTPGIHGDPALIQKALYHLIVNAIKYTPDGGQVTVTARPVMLEKDIPGVEVIVKDTGIGLDPEHHELIFEKFYQVGSVSLHSSGKTTFKGGGPGLGLAIVRGVARAHGGRAWVESPGYDEVNLPGCTFYLQLPVNPDASRSG